MSYYVKRENRETGKIGFVGPITSARQAGKEADAWVKVGKRAWILESTPEVKREVRTWQREANIRLGRA